MVAPRLLRFLTMLAILLMPFGMLGGAPPAAMGNDASIDQSASMTDGMSMAMPADHCADMAHKDKKAPTAPCCDCMMACAAIHSRDACVEHEALAPMAVQPAALTQ